MVDSNPDIIEYLNTKNIPCIFGDVNNHDVLEQLQLKNVTTVFSTVPDLRDNELLIRHIAKTNPSVNFVGITDSRNLAKDLYEIGAHYVLVTYVMAAAQFINKGAASNNTGIDLRTIIRDSETTRRKGQEHREVLFKEEDYVLEGDKDTEQN